MLNYLKGVLAVEEKKTLILIDGHALAFRSYFALERTGMKTTDKVPTWAVFGFFKAVFDLLKNQKIKPDAIAVAFDVGRQTFRVEHYEQYKANRETMPDTLRSQMGLICEGLQALNIPIYTKEGYEADDVIGTITREASQQGHKTLILTGDQDAFQLIDRDGLVSVLIPSKGELIEYDWEKVHEKLGVYPNQVVDYKALRGDTSDNIPGIRGIGEKTAVKLLARFHNLENILNSTDEIKEKALKQKLIDGIEMAKMSQFLATIKRDVDINFDINKTSLELPDVNKVVEFLKKVQLFSFLKNLDAILSPFDYPEDVAKEISEIADNPQKQEKPAHKETPEGQIQLGLCFEAAGVEQEPAKTGRENLKNSCHTIVSETQLSELVTSLKKQSLFAFDTETTSINALEADLVGISIAYNPDIQAKNGKIEIKENGAGTESFYIPVFHKYGEQLDLEYVLNTLKPVFEDTGISKTLQNAKYDVNALKKYGLDIKGVIFDTMLASYVKDPSRKHGLKVQALEHLDYMMKDIDELIGKGKSQITMDNVPIEDASDYACDDAFATLELTRYWAQNLDEEEKKLLYDIEMPTCEVLEKMEAAGITIDVDYLHKLSNELAADLSNVEDKIFQLAGTSFNINSPRQVGQILFEKLQIKPKGKKRGAKTFSTDVKVLSELAKDYEIAKHILDYRHFAKMKNTYVDALPELISPYDGKIHTSYNQTATVTGRLSSSNPNLQNIPVRTELGNRIRKAFIPSLQEEQVLLSADYSQIELRLLAHCSGDKAMIKAFQTGEDIHAEIAAKIFNVPLNEVTKEMRSRAKAVNFGIVYGQTRYGLAAALKISADEAQDFIDKYFATYPGIKDYMDKSVQYAYQKGYAKTMFGRKRYLLDELVSSNHQIKEFAQRAAINSPLQGAAADLIKMAMVELDKKLTNAKLKSQILLQVHDELILEVYKNELETVKKLVKESMELGQPLDVPLVVDFEIGSTWMQNDEEDGSMENEEI